MNIFREIIFKKNIIKGLSTTARKSLMNDIDTCSIWQHNNYSYTKDKSIEKK